VISADLPEALTDRAMGELRPVTVTAQVPEIQTPQFIRDDLLSDFGGSDIGEMTVAAEDALFDAPGAPGVFLEQLQVMIGLQQENIRRADAFDDQLRGIAEVGQKTEVARPRPQEKTDGIARVVWNGKSIDANVTYLKRRAGAENAAVAEFGMELIFHRLLGVPVAVNRNLEFCAQRCQALHMIAVFVCYEDAVETFWCAANSKEAIADLPPTEAGIDEQTGFFGFQISAIARRTTAQNREFDCHAPTLVPGNYQGKSFARRADGGKRAPISALTFHFPALA